MNTPITSVASRSVFSRWIDAVFTRIERLQRPGALIAIAAQFIVLSGMIFMQMIPHVSGTTVWLKVVPVDPRDMFRGDYVILSYEMNRPSSGSWPDFHPDGSTVGSAVYVPLVLDADGIHHRAERYLSEPPTSGLYIKGNRQTNGRIEYGIERFYVQAGTGLDYEQAARTGTLSAEIAIGGDGQAGVKQLRVGNR